MVTFANETKLGYTPTHTHTHAHQIPKYSRNHGTLIKSCKAIRGNQ